MTRFTIPTIVAIGTILWLPCVVAGDEIESLIADLKHPDARRRIDAACRLGELRPEGQAAIAALEEALADDDWRVRLFAGQSLEDLLPAEEREGLEDVLDCTESLKSTESDDRRLAIKKLARMGQAAKNAMPALVAVVAEKNGQISIYAASALSKIGPEGRGAVPILLAWLADGDAFRVDIVQVVGELGPSAAEAVPVLLELLARDEAPAMRFAACAALGGIGPVAKDAVPALTERIDDENRSVAISAMTALTKIEPTANGIMPTLLTWLGEENVTSRLDALRLLGDLGPDAAKVVPVLVEILARDSERGLARRDPLGEIDDWESAFRWQVLYRFSLLRSEGEEPVQLVEEKTVLSDDSGDVLIPEEDAEIREAVCAALGRIGPAAIPALLESLKEAPLDGDVGTVDALCQMGGVAIPFLMEAEGNKDARVRSGVILALGDIFFQRREGRKTLKVVVPSFIDCLDDPDACVRLAAINALCIVLSKRLESPNRLKGALPAVISSLGDEDAGVRSTAAFCLGELGSAAKGALPDLERLTNDDSESVREFARDAIAKINGTLPRTRERP